MSNYFDHWFVFVVAVAKSWSIEEKEAIAKHLGYVYQLRRAPRKNECLTALTMAPELCGRDWHAIKNHIASKVRYAKLRDAKK